MRVCKSIYRTELRNTKGPKPFLIVYGGLKFLLVSDMCYDDQCFILTNQLQTDGDCFLCRSSNRRYHKYSDSKHGAHIRRIHGEYITFCTVINIYHVFYSDKHKLYDRPCSLDNCLLPYSSKVRALLYAQVHRHGWAYQGL